MPSQGKVKISELQVNQEYENLLPPLLDEDLKNLEKSILKDGILHPFIINPDKVVLDGHHRLIICQRHSINEVPFVERSFNSDLEEMEFVISFNLHRRHLTTTQKVELALTILKIEMVKAKKRQAEAGKLYGEKHPKEELPLISEEALRLKETDDYFGRIFEKGKKTYCKYCHQNVHIAPGGGIWQCERCGAGLAAFFDEENSPAKEQGEAIEIAAKKVGLGKDTLWKGKQILEAAEKDPEAYKAWQGLAQGDGSINSAHQEIFHKEEEEPPIQTNPKIEGVFQVIVIDPPHFNLEKLKRTVIPFDEKNCVLWLWTPIKSLCDTFSLLHHWGFNAQTMFTWMKNKRGSGKWLLNQTEHCILATRGNPTPNSTSYSTALIAGPGAHHSKPDEFYSLVESLCTGRKLNVSPMILRRPGWEEFPREANPNAV